MKSALLTITDPNPVGSVTKYTITRNGTLLGAFPYPLPSFTDLPPSPGTYDYAVRPENPNEVGPEAHAVLVVSAPLMPVTVTVAFA